MKKIFIATKLDFQILIYNLIVVWRDVKDNFIELTYSLIKLTVCTILLLLSPITRPIVNFFIIKKSNVIKLDNDNLEALHRIATSQFKNDTFMQNVKYNHKFDYIVNTIIREHINKND